MSRFHFEISSIVTIEWVYEIRVLLCAILLLRDFDKNNNTRYRFEWLFPSTNKINVICLALFKDSYKYYILYSQTNYLFKAIVLERTSLDYFVVFAFMKGLKRFEKHLWFICIADTNGILKIFKQRAIPLVYPNAPI